MMELTRATFNPALFIWNKPPSSYQTPPSSFSTSPVVRFNSWYHQLTLYTRFYYVPANPLSRKLHRLRFKLDLWNKTLVHFSRRLFGAIAVHALDYFTTKSNVFEAGSRFMVLRVPIVKLAGSYHIYLEWKSSEEFYT